MRFSTCGWDVLALRAGLESVGSIVWSEGDGAVNNFRNLSEFSGSARFSRHHPA